MNPSLKEIRKNLTERPRIEMIPAILNLPLIAIVLALFLGYSSYWDLINLEALKIFGVGAGVDYVLISLVTCIFTGGYCILYIFLVLVRPRIAHLPVLNVIPILMQIIIAGFFSTVLSGNEWLNFNEIYNLLGDTLATALYVGIIATIILFGLLLLLGIPSLWKLVDNNPRTFTRYRPRFITISTIIGFFVGICFYVLFLLGNPVLSFWDIMLYRFPWIDPLPIIDLVAAAFFIAIIFSTFIRSRLTKTGRIKRGVNTRIMKMLIMASLVIQFIMVILMGSIWGYHIMALHPLATILVGEGLMFTSLLLKEHCFSTRPKGSVARRYEALFIGIMMVLPMTWIYFIQPIAQAPPAPQLAPFTVTVVKNSYINLTATQKTIFDEYLDYELPPGTQAAVTLTPSVSTRGKVRVASGLLFRNDPGDIENATVILEWLLPLQVTDASDNDYGAWRSSAGNSKIDQNWREFIGCELILILDRHAGKLSSTMISRIEQSLVRAAEGAMIRNVDPSYSNIALMSAFLMEHVGISMNRSDLEKAGTLKAWQCYLLFNEYGTFSEFNSPTYGGVDMLALALWRDLGLTRNMRIMGAEMEAALWREVASFYHAGLKNIVGPYFRAYGMDMTKYNAIIGIWIAIAIDNATTAPLPRQTGTNYFELSNILPAVQVGLAVPYDVISDLEAFTGVRYIKRTVPSNLGFFSKKYHVTVMIDEKWIMGGVIGRSSDSNQFKVGTIHWNASNPGSIASLVVLGRGVQEVKVSETSMTIQRNDGGVGIEFCVNCKDLVKEWFNGTTWSLPGINFTISGEPASINAETISSTTFKNEYSISEAVFTVVKVTCNLNAISLTPFLS